MKRGPKPIDISGQVFDRLVAVLYAGDQHWYCECACGGVTRAHGADLKRGKIRSCGCLWREKLTAGTRPIIHGGADTPEYMSFQAMHRRCNDTKVEGYENYGGRGIVVCDDWSDFTVFRRDLGERPPGTTLDRIDVNGNYEPDNCRWATFAVQSANRRDNVNITANGETKTITAWAAQLGTNTKTLRYRLKQGWSHHDAINKPIRAHKVH